MGDHTFTGIQAIVIDALEAMVRQHCPAETRNNQWQVASCGFMANAVAMRLLVEAGRMEIIKEKDEWVTAKWKKQPLVPAPWPFPLPVR